MIANWITISLLLFTTTSAKVMEECELVKTLEAAGFPKDLISNWVCLSKAESSLNTTAIGGPNRNGSYDYGIFQINDNIWCDTDKPGKRCNVQCSDLILEDSIVPSMECAKLIYSIQGFKAWHGWTKKCKGKVLPPLIC